MLGKPTSSNKVLDTWGRGLLQRELRCGSFYGCLEGSCKLLRCFIQLFSSSDFLIKGTAGLYNFPVFFPVSEPVGKVRVGIGS